MIAVSRARRRARSAPGLIIVAGTLLLASTLGARADNTLRERMLLAEDARAQTDAELAALRQGLTSRDLNVRRQAVRAIGRLERPDLIPALTRPLADANAEIRMEAANAVGQLARGADAVRAAKMRLMNRARTEPDPRVWAVVAATLGRLSYTTAADVQDVETALARVLPGQTTTAIQIDAVLGAVEGLEALARQSGKISRLRGPTLDGLRAASALEGRAQDADKLARIRRLATLALSAAGAVTRPGLERGIDDPDDEVRRLTMVAARAEVDGREPVVRKGLSDPSAQVRYEALQTWGRHLQQTSCAPVIEAVRDPSAHVALLAIDLLGDGCPPGQPAGVAEVRALAELLTARPGSWHQPAHALVALARLAPDEAQRLLPAYVGHPTWQVRMYAARAAAVLGALDALDQLGRDARDNVREAALSELVTLKRPEAARLAIEALGRPDYQLVRTAARALANPPDPGRAAAALVGALTRITAERRDTSRDSRLAILDTLQAIGGTDGAPLGADPGATLRPYLADFDPAVSTRVAELLRAWTKEPAAPAPQPLTRPAVSLDDVEALRGVRLRFVMGGQRPFDLQLLIDEAPLSALRVATLARAGYYNGLTFHRVVPNFVIQGGSPGANEYAGDGPYMRDEVGLVPHRRGTVGISTRGRDTGDAQIFVNLVDLPRLDHTYTVFAEVVSGMNVVDEILEGDVIERVEIIHAATR